MNRQILKEEIQKVVQRWHALRQQYGDLANNVPEYVQLTKFIKMLQQNQQAILQRQQQQQQQQPQQQSQVLAQSVQSPQQHLQQSPLQDTQMPSQPQRQPSSQMGSSQRNMGDANFMPSSNSDMNNMNMNMNSNMNSNMNNNMNMNANMNNNVNNSMNMNTNMNANNMSANNMSNMNGMNMNNMSTNNMSMNNMNNMGINNMNGMNNTNNISGMNNMNNAHNMNSMGMNKMNNVNNMMGTPTMPYSNNPMINQSQQTMPNSQNMSMSNSPRQTPSSVHSQPQYQNQFPNLGQGQFPQPQLLAPQQQQPIPPQQQQQMYQNNNSNSSGSANQLGGGSAFTHQQFQVVKAQYQALKLLLKNPGSGNPQIPQNLIEFVTNERLAFANGNYLQLAQGDSSSPQVAQAPPVSAAASQPPPQQAIPPQTMPQQSAPQPMQTQVPPSQQVRPPVQQPQVQQPQQVPTQNNAPLMSNMATPVMNNGGDSVPSSRSNNSPYVSQPGPSAPTQQPAPSKRGSKAKPQPQRNQSVSKAKKKDDLKVVPMKPQPPKYLEDLVPNKSENKKTIIPVEQPNIQVDCFEVPHLIGDKVEEIPYNHIYSSQTRFQYPGLYPDGFDIKEIKQTRESFILLKIDERLLNLKWQLEQNKELDEVSKENIQAEINKLELLPFQKQLKGKLLSHVWFNKSLLPNSHPNFLAKYNSLSIANVAESHELYKQQVHSLLQAQNQKHQNLIGDILSSTSARKDRIFSKKDKLERFTSKVTSFHNQVAKEEQKRVERMAKQRLQALKLNDEEAYLKLLDHTKDTRITHLLKQTNSFLDSLAQAVQSQQREAKSGTGEEGVVPAEMTEDERREKLDYYHVAHRVKEVVTKQPSILVGGTLKEYQIKGLQWMVSLYNNHLNGILADEMGLGKTIQTISLITYLIEFKHVPGPFLVIVPLSTLTNWNLEFEKWAPSIKKITYKGTPNQRKVLQHDVKTGNFQLLLTTFEYIIKDRNLLSRVKWVHMIIDEGHRMKNSSSKLSETLTHHYHSDNRLILTGTPLQNNLPELWALLNFVLPKIFNSVKSFDEWFNTPFANTGGQDKIELTEEETLLIIRRLHKVLRPFLLRRLKKDVEKDLPNKVEKVVKCKMSSVQAKLYQQMLRYNVLYAADANGTPVTIKNANNQIMQLRKICNHPFVYEEVENLINPKSENNHDIWRVAGKFELLDRILPKFKATGHRVLIFFQMTQIMDIMEDFLRLRNLKYMRLDGATKADDRTGLLKLFNDDSSDYFCFLLSTRAGGLGLNLQTADTVIIFDTDWNPHQDLQAQDRAHRIGQKNEVRILRLITEDSVEEMILERAHAKLEIDGKVIQAGKFDNKSTAEEQEALLRALIEKEEERKQNAEDEENELDDDELNQIIARNDGELDTFKYLDEQRVIETRESSYPTRLFSDQELPEVYKADPGTLIKKDEIIVDEYGRGTRERKVAHYDDHLTEEQWLKQIDGVVSDSDGENEVAKPKRARGRPKGKPKSSAAADMNDFIENDSDDESSLKRTISQDGHADDLKVKKQRSLTPSSVVSGAGASGGSNVRGKGRGRGRARGGRGRKVSSQLNRMTPSIDPLTPKERDDLQALIDTIYQSIINYTNEAGRNLSELFLVKPSKKFYPDYYVLIKNPLAFDTIKKRIASKTYTDIREFLEDIHLIFSNARIYNEEGSVVFEDAKILESLAMEKFQELSNLPEEKIERIINFEEFDQIYSLKPLAIPKPADSSTTQGSKVSEEGKDKEEMAVKAPILYDNESHNDNGMGFGKSSDKPPAEAMNNNSSGQSNIPSPMLDSENLSIHGSNNDFMPVDMDIPEGIKFDDDDSPM